MSQGMRRAFGLTLMSVLATGCSDRITAPSAELDGVHSSQGVSGLTVTPSSIGWQEQARTLVAANRLSPLAAARVYAALSVAQYRAVRSIHDPDSDGLLPSDGIGTGGRSALEARRGAVAGASAQVLSFFFPAAAANLEQRVAMEGEAGPGGVHPQFERGLGMGRSAGDAVVTRTRNDRFTAPWTGTVPVGPGMWIANGPPAGAVVGGVTPYLLESGSQFRPPPPPAFGSAAFLADVEEIRVLAINRTPEQRAIALAWDYTTGTFTPPGYWNLVAAEYVKADGLNEAAATRTFALMSAAVMDAVIGCWDAKYYYWVMRPVQVEPSITMTYGLPNHPSYPSGHSCVSASAATVLGHLFPERTGELGPWVNEAGLSRMYGGIHYRFDITAGRILGEAVGQWAIGHAERLN